MDICICREEQNYYNNRLLILSPVINCVFVIAAILLYACYIRRKRNITKYSTSNTTSIQSRNVQNTNSKVTTANIITKQHTTVSNSTDTPNNYSVHANNTSTHYDNLSVPSKCTDHICYTITDKSFDSTYYNVINEEVKNDEETNNGQY